MEETHSAEPRTRADDWLDGMSDDERLIWLHLRPAAQEKVKQRLDAVLRLLDEDDPVSPEALIPKVKDVKTGEEKPIYTVRRLYQLAEAWKFKRGLAALGARAARPATRPSNLDDGMLPSREAALAEMRSLLAEDVPPRTEEALRRVVEVVGTGLSRKTLLRWWTAERRRVANGRVLGRELALDVCWIGAVDPSGQPYRAAFVVDVGARLILAGSLIDELGIPPAYARVAADAQERLRNLPLEHLAGAERVERLTIAAPPDILVTQLMGLIGELGDETPIQIDPKENAAVGRTGIGVAGQRFGLLRLSGSVPDVGTATERSEPHKTVAGALPRLTATNAALLLDGAIKEHLAKVAELVSGGPPAPGGRSAAVRAIEVLRNVRRNLTKPEA